MDSIRNLLGLTFLAISLTACTLTASNQSRPSTNSRDYSIDCSGVASRMSVCYEKAKMMCPDGYTIISHQVTALPVGNTLLNEPSSANAYSNPSTTRQIIIQCN